MPRPATRGSPGTARGGATWGLTPRAASTSAGSQIPASRSARPLRPTTSEGVPRSVGRPSGPRTSTRSARRHASSTRCSTRTIVVPAARSAASRSTKARAPSGSRFAVGSSRTSRRERGASAPARASRCCWPPDSVVVRSRPRPPRPDLGEGDGDAVQHLPPGPAPVLEPECDIVLDSLHDQLCARVLEDDPDRAADAEGAFEAPGHLAAQEPGEGEDERALARPRRAHDQQALARGDVHVDVPQGRCGGAGMGEAEAAGDNCARFHPTSRRRGCRRQDPRRRNGRGLDGAALRQAGKPRRTPASRSPRTIACVTIGMKTAAEMTIHRKVRASTSGATPW